MMLLCDLVTAFAGCAHNPVGAGLPQETASLGTYRAQFAQMSGLAKELSRAPRFILDDNVVEAAIDTLLSKPSSLLSAATVLRAPWPLMWMEWADEPAQAARRERGVLFDNEKDSPRRVGFLMRSTGDGRTGRASLLWTHGKDFPDMKALPAVCPLEIHFDLDELHNPAPEDPAIREDASDYYHRWIHHPVERDAILRLNQAFSRELSTTGRSVLEAMAMDLGEANAAATAYNSALDDTEGEALNLLSLCLMLASTNAVETREESREKINRGRRRKKQPELLDHIVATLKLGKLKRIGPGAAEGAGSAGPRRAHWVRGHFVNRGGKIFWRQAHTRGFGREPLKKTINVTL